MQNWPTPNLCPQSVSELVHRAQALTGMTLGQLAFLAASEPPDNLLRKKGWIGQLLEWHLGASAGNLSEPDFPHLGIELKTIPVDKNHKPLETTYVCTAPLTNVGHLTWETSPVYKKLRHVLWIPVLSEKDNAIASRMIQPPVLWQPNPEQAQMLQQDWEELMDMICLGQLEHITASLGEYLHIRPKAANSRALSWGIDAAGNKIQTLPRGFYLRTQLTQQIIMP